MGKARTWLAGVAVLALLAAPVAPVLAVTPVAGQAAPAPLADLVRAVDIPYEQFTLDNGLRVIVHTDRKAPIVAVSMWYHIGSKDEPKGKTGFAHLFEHLMFYGSENNDEVFFKRLNAVGATALNGTTWFDRTNYFQNVPTPALDLTLFLESDRMGYLLGAVTQEKLDAQRAVVQNEKRQGDNQPMGLTQYATLKALFPELHPYAHSTIGSMADLDAASLEDVRGWFRANYGPNNAVLVLAGDIDVATAREKVTRYFGAIPKGPEVTRFEAPVPRWTETRTLTMQDRIPTPSLERSWALPGQLDPQAALLNVALTILAGGDSSRLYNALVRDAKLAVSVGGGVQSFEKVSLGEISATLVPGAEPAAVNAAVDKVMADFLRDGPTEDEVARVATRAVAGTIRGLEAVGSYNGKAATLAEGALYAGDPGDFKRDLAVYADATPATVVAAAREWLAKGDFRLTVMPGPREKAEDAAARVAAKAAPPAPAVEKVQRMPMPGVEGMPELAAPVVARAVLGNGMKVTLSRRDAVPVVRMQMNFAGGLGSDDAQAPGTAGLAMALLDEGAGGMSGPEIAEARERLGVSWGGGLGSDLVSVSLDALRPNLAGSLALFSRVVQAPDFAAADVERVRGQVLTGIEREMSDPGALARRTLPGLLFGAGNPYGRTSSGTLDGVKAVTRDALADWHKRWIRPDNGEILVVGDVTMAELLPMLEASFGGWKADPTVARGVAPPVGMRSAAGGRILLIDRPNSPQSYIRGGVLLPREGRDDGTALLVANDILGGMTSSRLNTNIREQKGWAYGVGSVTSDGAGQQSWQIVAPVQADRTGDAMAAIIADVKALSGGSRPVSADERAESVDSNIRSLPGSFESGRALLGALSRNALLGRPDDYHAKLGPRLQALDVADVQAAAGLLSTENFTWVVVGDATSVLPQLKKLGLPVEVRR
jgi:zinc protease